MILEAKKCHNCQSEQIVRNGHNSCGQQRYKCKNCGVTIRQRFSRLVRKTLSFSKKEYMLNLHFKLWAYYYNLEIKNQL